MNIRQHPVVKEMNDFIFQKGYAVKIEEKREPFIEDSRITFTILSSGAVVEIKPISDDAAHTVINGVIRIYKLTDEELEKLLSTREPILYGWIDEPKGSPDKTICESGIFGFRKIRFGKGINKKFYSERVIALVDNYISYPSPENMEALKILLDEALKKDAVETLANPKLPIGPIVRDTQGAEKHNDGKLEWSLVDFKALEPMVRVLMKGAVKYSPDNWKKGLSTRSILDSLMRHLSAIASGEDNDPETGEPHIGHLMCNAMFYSWMVVNKPELDNR